MRYYGQRDLDKYIHDNFIKKPVENGTFLELGAIDGIKFNTTKFFEDEMGFDKGILIEPIPDSYKNLIKNRPKCYNFNYAIHPKLEEVVFWQSEQNAVGCIKDGCTEEFKKRWHNNPVEIKVPANTLSNIISKTDIKYIDLFILDVEGFEFPALQSMNWSIPVGLLCVEMNHQKGEINTLLGGLDFKIVGNHGHNYFYFNSNYYRKDIFEIKK